MMRPAFTLMEVLVAAMIASVAGLALMQTSSNNNFLFERLKHVASMSEQVSVIGFNGDIAYNRTTKSLYDMLDKRYLIDNDELRTYLKDKKFDYREQVAETITFGESGMQEIEDENPFSMDESDSKSAQLLQFELIRISIKNDTEQGMILRAKGLDATF